MGFRPPNPLRAQALARLRQLRRERQAILEEFPELRTSTAFVARPRTAYGRLIRVSRRPHKSV